MRHNKKFNHLSRKKGHRDALLSNLTIALIMHKRINTTLAKAKALRVYAEPIITRSKKDDTANRRLVFSYLRNKEAVKELFGVVAEKVADRPGDNAETCFIELVDFNEARLSAPKDEKKGKTTRRSRRKAAPKAEAAPAEEPKAEAPAAEAEEEAKA